jgi:hypothetical protein
MITARQPAPISRGPLAITTVLTGVVGAGIIAQGLIAGLFLDGSDNQRAIDVHEILGPLLVLVGLASAIVSCLRLRGSPSGRKVSYATVGLTSALHSRSSWGSSHPTTRRCLRCTSL